MFFLWRTWTLSTSTCHALKGQILTKLSFLTVHFRFLEVSGRKRMVAMVNAAPFHEIPTYWHASRIISLYAQAFPPERVFVKKDISQANLTQTKRIIKSLWIKFYPTPTCIPHTWIYLQSRSFQTFVSKIITYQLKRLGEQISEPLQMDSLPINTPQD